MPRMMEILWEALLRVAWGIDTPPPIRATLLGQLEGMHPSCIEHATRVVQQLHELAAAQAEEGRKKKGKEKKKKKGDDEPEDVGASVRWCFQEDVLELLARFFGRLGERCEADADAVLPRSLAAMLGQCVAVWLQGGGADSGRRLPTHIRYYATRMARVFLQPSSGLTEKPPAVAVLQWLSAWTPPPRRVYLEAAYTQVPEPVLRLLPPHEEPEEEWDERNRHKLEVALVDAVTALLEVGPLAAGGGEALLGNVLYYLQMVALRGPHVREPVEKALAVFLRMQPQTAPIFIEYAVVEVVHEQLCLTMPAAELLSSMHLSALVTNWSADLASWEQAVPPVRMLLASLLHQCSADASSRRLALGLAGALASHPTTPLDAGAALPDPAFVMLSSCVAMTYRYSLALASKYSAALAEPLPDLAPLLLVPLIVLLRGRGWMLR